MKVVFATLAEYAKVDSEQRFSITGGDFREVRVGATSTLALAARLEFDEKDLGVDHIINIISSGPTGQEFVRPYSLVVRAENAGTDGGHATFPFVYTMEDVRIVHRGTHRLLIRIGDADLAEVHFNSVGVSPAPDQKAPEWLTGLEESIQAFREGNFTHADELLVGLTSAFPELAIAHNNLGFVRLVTGRAAEALPELERAYQLQFDRPEVLIANMGVCRYLLGDPVGAQSLFRFCLTRFSFMQGAWLLGLHDDRTFLQTTASALNYMELISLNDAWTSFRIGDVAGARQACARASTSAMTEEASSPFAVSTRDLGGRLHLMGDA